jgi:MtrB/PioB family decaheme-associated outer membrane protein
MKIYSPLFLLAALGVLSAAGTAAAQVDTSAWKCSSCPFPKGTHGTVDVGVGAVSDDSAKFGDYTGLERDGAHLVLGGAASYRGESGYFADVIATELGLDSRRLAVQSGREGLYTLRLGYARIPRHLWDDASTPFLGSGGAVLTLPAGFPAGDTASMPLSTTLRPIGLGYKSERFDLGGSLIQGQNWTYRVSLRRDIRDGTKPTSGAFIADAAQFVAPVDHVTDQFELSAAYASRGLQATLGYQGSWFRNGFESLTWANPFTPLVAGSTQGQLALAPDNQFHQIFGSAGYQLSPTIRASADFAFGRMTQDAGYLAPTLNPGLAATVPAPSLDGQVDTFNGSVRISAAPMDGLRVSASYARNVRDNRTSVLSYPQVVNDTLLDPASRSNTPFSFTQDWFKLNADYRGPATWKFAAGLELDNQNRSYAEVADTRETTLWGRVGVQPREDLSLAFKLAHADRSNSAYGTAIWFGAPENPLLRKLNLASRKRDSASLRADVALSARVNLGLGAEFANDDYDETRVGLQEVRSTSLSADLSVAFSEQTRLTAFAQAERQRSLQSGSQSGGAADWTARHKDRFEVVGLGLKHAAIPDKLDLGADLTFSRSHSDLGVATGVGEPPFPTATTSLDSLKLYATYQLQKNLSLTGSYWYERYDSQDWHLAGVLPATVPDLLVFGIQPPRYRVNVVRVYLRYRF